MTKFRIINILSISALILLLSAFIFPVMKHEDREYTYRLMLFWIWGLPYYSSEKAVIFMIPFIFFSIGITVEIVLFLKSYFIFIRDNTKINVVSRDWIIRGREIIYLVLLWNLWLLAIYFIWPFGIYYIEPPMFLPLVGGVLLIIAGNLYRRFDVDEGGVLNRGSNLKFMSGLYVFVFILYSIFFLIFFAFFIFPPFTYLEYIYYYRLLFGLYYYSPMLLILLIVKFIRFLDDVKINNPHEHKLVSKLYTTTLLIIGILMLIYFLLNLYILPIYAELFWWD